MSNDAMEKSFAGQIPQIYDACLVPLIFAPYAVDLAERLQRLPVTRVLELAAGTGVVTRAMASSLPEGVSIVATDLNQPMLDHASRIGTARPVEWRQADATTLPFADATFDAVVCQFGVMFFPDRARAYAEARRVLKPGGVFLFNVWDRLETNEFARAVQEAADRVFPVDPPQFLARVPHGYFERARIAQDLADGGFTATPAMTTLARRSRAESARAAATAYCHGTPLRNLIEARDAARLADVVDVASGLVAERFGTGAVEGGIQAHVVSVRK